MAKLVGGTSSKQHLAGGVSSKWYLAGGVSSNQYLDCVKITNNNWQYNHFLLHLMGKVQIFAKSLIY